jgi:hypothetical protein
MTILYLLLMAALVFFSFGVFAGVGLAVWFGVLSERKPRRVRQVDLGIPSHPFEIEE